MEGEEAPPPLPPGWTAVQHRELGECYINQVSRACTWSRPRVADTDRPEQHPMPPDEGPLASMCALEEQRAIREAYERARERDNSNFHLAPQERLHRELDRRPSAQYSWSGSGQWKVRRLPPLQHPEWNGAVAGLSSGSGDPVMSHFIPDWVALNAKEPPRPKSKSK